MIVGEVGWEEWEGKGGIGQRRGRGGVCEEWDRSASTFFAGRGRSALDLRWSTNKQVTVRASVVRYEGGGRCEGGGG